MRIDFKTFLSKCNILLFIFNTIKPFISIDIYTTQPKASKCKIINDRRPHKCT
nr:MAG TPA: hypothetical protein [Caudoviricetes sp.]